VTSVRRVVTDVIKKTPVLGPLARRIAGARRARPIPFTSSADYWERRYATGGTSGAGSSGEFAAFKAEVVNAFVAEHDVRSVIEFGCGDGDQLALGCYPSYVGLDVSASVVERCRRRFRADATKSFLMTDAYDGRTADLALSLDVLYHLVEDDVFEEYLHTLFGAAERFVVIYATDRDEPLGPPAPHVRYRRFTTWIEDNIVGWRLTRRIANRTVADPEFFVYASSTRER
jgi:hypothetical protein